MVSVNKAQCAAGANASNMGSATGAQLLLLLISGEFLWEIVSKTFAARFSVFIYSSWN